MDKVIYFNNSYFLKQTFTLISLRIKNIFKISMFFYFLLVTTLDSQHHTINIMVRTFVFCLVKVEVKKNKK